MYILLKSVKGFQLFAMDFDLFTLNFGDESILLLGLFDPDIFYALGVAQLNVFFTFD